MRFYAACLASYNNGVLHGHWIDASNAVDAMQAEINVMLRESRFPNVMVAVPDYETAARAAGWRVVPVPFRDSAVLRDQKDESEPRYVYAESWQTACEADDIEPAEKSVPSAEEWAIHDSEGLGDLGEYAGLAEVARRAAVAELAEDRDIPLAVLLELANDQLSGEWDSNDLESEVDDHYHGQYDTWSDFAQEITEETTDMKAIPEWLQGHIDWQSIGRDFELSGDFTAYTETENSRPLYMFSAN